MAGLAADRVSRIVLSLHAAALAGVHGAFTLLQGPVATPGAPFSAIGPPCDPAHVTTTEARAADAATGAHHGAPSSTAIPATANAAATSENTTATNQRVTGSPNHRDSAHDPSDQPAPGCIS